MKETIQLGCLSHDSPQNNLFSEKLKNWDRITPSRSPRTTIRYSKNVGKKGSFAGSHATMCTPRANSVASKIRGKNARRNPETGAVRPQRRMEPGKGYLLTQKKVTAEAWVMPAPSPAKPEERHIVIDSGASMHMLTKNYLNSGELKTLKRSRSPTTVVTASVEVQTNEEAQACAHDLHIFVTVQFLEDTPAVLSLGKLCREHGYTYEWPSGREPRLTKNGNQTFCRTENFVLW